MTQWFEIAQGELGQQEAAGDQDNPRVLEYLGSVPDAGATHDSTPWCAGFANWCLDQAGQPTTQSLMARSFLGYGKKLSKPVKGCIVVLTRGAPPNGHVGFYSHEKGGKVYLLGGNQGDKVSISGFPKSDVLAYRMPHDKPAIVSRTTLGAGTAVGGGATIEAVKAIPAPPDLSLWTAWQATGETVASLGSWAWQRPVLTAGLAVWIGLLTFWPNIAAKFGVSS